MVLGNAGRSFTYAVLNRATATNALSIWREAATWLISREMPLWDPSSFDEAFIDRTLQSGEIVGVFSQSFLVGVGVVTWTDDEWWPDRPGLACYLHKIAVKRVNAGTGVLETLLIGCEALSKSCQVTLMRLDAAADRPKLHSVYERFGFARLDTRTVGAFTAVRFEKAISACQSRDLLDSIGAGAQTRTP